MEGKGREGSRRSRQKQEAGRTQRRAEMRLRAERNNDKAVSLSVLAQGIKAQCHGQVGVSEAVHVRAHGRGF